MKCKTCRHPKEIHNEHRGICWNIGKKGYDCECKNFISSEDEKYYDAKGLLFCKGCDKLKEYCKCPGFVKQDDGGGNE